MSGGARARQPHSDLKQLGAAAPGVMESGGAYEVGETWDEAIYTVLADMRADGENELEHIQL